MVGRVDHRMTESYTYETVTISEDADADRAVAFSVSCMDCPARLDRVSWREAVDDALYHVCPSEALDEAAARIAHPAAQEARDGHPGPPSDEDEGLLTQAEHDCIMVLGEAHEIFRDQILGPEPHGAQDDAEFISHIHDLQARVMAHAASRAYPDRYRLAGG